MPDIEKMKNTILAGIDHYSQTVSSHKAAVAERENLIALSIAYQSLNSNHCNDDCKVYTNQIETRNLYK